MTNSDLTCDVLVIGGGPAGFTAGLYAARAGLRTTLSSPMELSGMMAMAPRVENFPGQLDAPTGRELLAKIRQQALAAGVEQVLETVAGVNFTRERGLQVYGGAQMHVAAAVIIATGAMAAGAKLPGEEEFLGRGVAYCVACDGPLFQGERVLVVGNDEQALEEAITLSEIAEHVTYVTARRQLGVEGPLAEAVERTANLEVVTGLKLEEILGDDMVTGARFLDADKRPRVLEGAGIFLYLRGRAPATDFLLDAVALDEQGYIITDELMQTSVPGVFAAGDVRSKLVRQMCVAAGEGAVAALAAERYIRGGGAIRSDRGAAKGASENE